MKGRKSSLYLKHILSSTWRDYFVRRETFSSEKPNVICAYCSRQNFLFETIWKKINLKRCSLEYMSCNEYLWVLLFDLVRQEEVKIWHNLFCNYYTLLCFVLSFLTCHIIRGKLWGKVPYSLIFSKLYVYGTIQK